MKKYKRKKARYTLAGALNDVSRTTGLPTDKLKPGSHTSTHWLFTAPEVSPGNPDQAQAPAPGMLAHTPPYVPPGASADAELLFLRHRVNELQSKAERYDALKEKHDDQRFEIKDLQDDLRRAKQETDEARKAKPIMEQVKDILADPKGQAALSGVLQTLKSTTAQPALNGPVNDPQMRVLKVMNKLEDYSQAEWLADHVERLSTDDAYTQQVAEISTLKAVHHGNT